jgi:hypothetical protein
MNAAVIYPDSLRKGTKAMFIESLEDAVKWRRLHRKKLKRGNKRQRRVAGKLSKCRRGNRCGTEACRVCMRDFRIWWPGEAIKIIAQRPHWTRCSVITKGLLVRYGRLQKFDLNAEVKRIRKRLERSEIRGRIVLGALDVSLNIENNVIAGWQFHTYLIVEGQNDAALRQAIKHAFPPEPSALAPYNFVEVSNPLDVVTYAYKALFERRSGYKDSQGKHQTKNQPLKRRDVRELLPFLAKYKVGVRLILSGVRRNGQRLVFTSTKRASAPQT